MEKLLSIRTPFPNGICRWLEGLKDDSIRETDRKAEVNSEKKRRRMEITSLQKVLEAYNFSTAYHVSTEAHFYMSVY